MRVEHFEGLVRLAFQGFVNDRINSTLQRASDIANTAVSTEDEHSSSQSEASGRDEHEEDTDGGKNIVTTVEEVQGYELVKTIVSDVVDGSRIAMRDTQSYCGVLLDDNNRKTICRLWFNRASVKYLGLLDENRKETRHLLETVDDISKFAEDLRLAARRHIE